MPGLSCVGTHVRVRIASPWVNRNGCAGVVWAGREPLHGRGRRARSRSRHDEAAAGRVADERVGGRERDRQRRAEDRVRRRRAERERPRRRRRSRADGEVAGVEHDLARVGARLDGQRRRAGSVCAAKSAVRSSATCGRGPRPGGRTSGRPARAPVGRALPTPERPAKPRPAAARRTGSRHIRRRRRGAGRTGEGGASAGRLGTIKIAGRRAAQVTHGPRQESISRRNGDARSHGAAARPSAAASAARPCRCRRSRRASWSTARARSVGSGCARAQIASTVSTAETRSPAS